MSHTPGCWPFGSSSNRYLFYLHIDILNTVQAGSGQAKDLKILLVTAEWSGFQVASGWTLRCCILYCNDFSSSKKILI